jgi:hypothetical protein
MLLTRISAAAFQKKFHTYSTKLVHQLYNQKCNCVLLFLQSIRKCATERVHCAYYDGFTNAPSSLQYVITAWMPLSETL